MTGSGAPGAAASGYRADFAAVPWESPLPGMRAKTVRSGDRQVRLVEYTPELAPHWCELGHLGLVLEGRLEVEFAGGAVVFGPGDGVTIPSGPAHRHRGRALTDVVRAVFVEDVGSSGRRNPPSTPLPRNPI